MRKRRKPLDPWQEEDAKRLRALFDKRAGLTQEAFGAQFDLGTQGSVWQYLEGRVPLNLTAAIKFAKGLNVAVHEISPTLAQLLPGGTLARSVGEPAGGILAYNLRVLFPELTDRDVSEILEYARWKAEQRKAHGDINAPSSTPGNDTGPHSPGRRS